MHPPERPVGRCLVIWLVALLAFSVAALIAWAALYLTDTPPDGGTDA